MKILEAHENVGKKIRKYDTEEFERMKAYPQENFRRVMNPLAWPLEAGCNGTRYRIPGFTTGELETFDVYHVEHIVKSLKEKGLVTLEYGKEQREKYADFEDYVSAMEVAGLKRAYDYWSKILELQKKAVTDMQKLGGTDYENAKAKQKTMQKMVDSIKGWITDAGAEVKTKEVETISLERPKKKEAKEAKEVKEEKDAMDLKVTKSGKYMLNGKFISKEKYEELKNDTSTVTD